MGWVIGFILVIAVLVALARSGSKKPAKRRAAPRSTTVPESSRSSAPARQNSSQRSSAAAKRTRREFPITWFGRDAELEVAGIRIKSPCVYASSGSSDAYGWATDPSEILIEAPVRRPRESFAQMGYWPWYSRIEPEHRYEYLSWLASGRTNLPPSEGYLFLYYYGIERRLLVDEADRAWGLKEIVRLRRLDQPRVGTREGRSFRQYTTVLLWFEIARTPDRFDASAFDLVASLTERWTPELFTAPLAWLAANERPLPPRLARHIAASDPASQRSVVVKRISSEFEELFDTRYRDAFGGDGITLRVSQRPAWCTYRPASGGLSEMRCKVANPLGIKSQFKQLPEIWNSCIADLRKLSRVAATTTDGALTLEAWEAMPPELRAEVDHPLADQVSALVAGDAVEPEKGSEIASGPAMVPAGRLAELVGIERRPTLTATQSRRVAAIIESTGYGLVPDARISSIRYGWDHLLAVIPGLDDEDVEPTRYNAAACVLRLGLMIAQADGEADELEVRMLTDHIDAVFDLSSEEQERLAALRDLLLRTGSDIRPVARKIKEMLPPEARGRVGRLLVVIAAATNGIDRSERAALRKAFRALDLPPELLEETIGEVSPDAGESVVRVRGATEAETGEPIPTARAHSFRLNHQAISSIMAETREVSVMLAAAMDAANAESEVEEPAPRAVRSAEPQTAALDGAVATETPAATQAAEVVGPGGRYEPLFVALIDRDRWARDQADGLARSLGLMLDAGVEAINDWAFDALGAPLIEDQGDELIVDRSLLQGDG